MRRVAVLLHLYLIFRIVCCPCLTGQNVHDQATRSLFLWSGSTMIVEDDLGNPLDTSTEAGACMCDGANAPTCPDCPPPDQTGSPLEAPAIIEAITFVGVDALIDATPGRRLRGRSPRMRPRCAHCSRTSAADGNPHRPHPHRRRIHRHASGPARQERSSTDPAGMIRPASSRWAGPMAVGRLIPPPSPAPRIFP